jgi:uncharacterized membrane protein YhaH (DUF805 family)
MADASGGRIPRDERLFHGAAAVLLAAVFAASLFQIGFLDAGLSDDDPAGSLCFLRRTTGLPCLSCGMTRSFYALGRGAVAEAFREHPLGPLVFLLLAVVLVRSAGIAVTGRRWMDRAARVLVWSLAVVAAAALVAWAVRLGWMFWTGAAGEAWRLSALSRLIN